MAKIPVGYYDDDSQTLNDGNDFYIDDWLDGSCGDLVGNVGFGWKGPLQSQRQPSFPVILVYVEGRKRFLGTGQLGYSSPHEHTVVVFVLYQCTCCCCCHC